MSAQAKLQVQCKRAYEDPASSDGFRLLVDGLWPRGVSKVKLKLDQWDKSLAPTTELRRWFNHEPIKWAAFYQKYHKELRQNLDEERIKELLKLARGDGLTLVYAAHDEDHNNAVALRMFLLDQ